MDEPARPARMRFGVFEVDLQSGELRKAGVKVGLQEQPFRILARLLERPGELVTRDELRKEVWPGDTFVDFEHGLNAAIKRLRDALGDSAETPRFIETLPRRGYRFIASVSTDGAPAGLTGTTKSGPAVRWSSPVLAGIIMAAVATMGVSIVMWNRPVPKTPPAGRFQLQPPSGVRVVHSEPSALVAISPDAQWVAFAGYGDDLRGKGLYLRRIDDVEARMIPGTRTASGPFFSADSEWLGFVAEGKLQKVPVRGGAPQPICDAAQLRGASWGEDGTILFSTGEGLLAVSEAGGDPAVLTRPKPGERHYWPHLIPGTRAAVFTRWQGGFDRQKQLAVLSIDTREIRDLMRGTAARYLTSGHLLYAKLGTLYAVEFDRKTLAAGGVERMILDDIHHHETSGNSAFDVARNGSITYLPGAPRLEQNELVWVDRSGRVEPLPEPRQGYGSLAISPNGRRVVISIATTMEDSDLWVYEFETRAWSRLTSALAADHMRWSRDGRWIVFSSFLSGHAKLYRIRADGGPAEQLTSGGEAWDFAGGLTSGSESLVFRRFLGNQFDILRMPFRPGAAAEPLLATPAFESEPALSPDDRWMAYESNETGTRRVMVRSLPDGRDPVSVSTEPGSQPRWSHDGRELVYRSGAGAELWSVRVVPGRVFKGSTPARVLRVPFWHSVTGTQWFDLSRDGRFLMVRREQQERQERLLMYAPNWIGQTLH